jgi:hypothetical protein
MANEQHDKKIEDLPHLPSSIKQFFFQLRLIAEKKSTPQFLDQVVIIRKKAEEVMLDLEKEKDQILGQFDRWLISTAKEVIEKIYNEAKRLKEVLNQSDRQIEELDWQNYTKEWAFVISKWVDRKKLVDNVLNLLSERSSQLIDKDIRLIQDYQNQSIAHLPEGSEDLANMQERLIHVIEEPMKQLFALKNQCLQHSSLRQASEWIIKFHQQRENYFDQLLMKIDTAVKEIVQIDDQLEEKYPAFFSEDEGEVAFMENEVDNLKPLIEELESHQKNEVTFIKTRLNEILEHANQLKIQRMPKNLKERIEELKQSAHQLLSSLDWII